MDEPIERVHERSVYRNPHVEVFDDEVRFAGRGPGSYVRVVPGGVGPGVVLIPQGPSGIALVRTYRYPVSEWQWALPRGFGHDVSPLRTAAAELREELGLTAQSYEELGSLTPDSGLMQSEVVVVLARVGDVDLVPLDCDEVNAARWATLDDIMGEIVRGDIRDGFTMAALCLAQARGAL